MEVQPRVFVRVEKQKKIYEIRTNTPVLCMRFIISPGISGVCGVISAPCLPPHHPLLAPFILTLPRGDS